MTRDDLISAMAEQAEIPKKAAERALAALLENLMKDTAKGEKTTLIGFGTFSRGERAARTGRNPQTGAELKIAASKTVKFTPGKAFKDMVNKKKK